MRDFILDAIALSFLIGAGYVTLHLVCALNDECALMNGML